MPGPDEELGDDRLFRYGGQSIDSGSQAESLATTRFSDPGAKGLVEGSNGQPMTLDEMWTHVEAWQSDWATRWPVYSHSSYNDLARTIMLRFGSREDIVGSVRSSAGTSAGNETAITQQYILDVDRILSGTYLRRVKRKEKPPAADKAEADAGKEKDKGKEADKDKDAAKEADGDTDKANSVGRRPHGSPTSAPAHAYSARGSSRGGGSLRLPRLGSQKASSGRLVERMLNIMQADSRADKKKARAGPDVRVHSLPRYVTPGQGSRYANMRKFSEVAFGRDMVNKKADHSVKMASPAPACATYCDTLELRTCEFLWERLRTEQRSGAIGCFVLMALSLLATVTASVVMGFAAQSRHETRLSYVIFINGLMVGVVQILFGILGLFGAILHQETYIRWTNTGGLLTLALLTVLLFSCCSMIHDTSLTCDPKDWYAADPAGPSCRAETEHFVTLLVFTALSILNSFFIVYTCDLQIDSLNDSTKVQDSLLLLKYFNYRHAILRDRLDATFGVQKFGRGGQYRTFNNISPAYAAAKGLSLEHTKLMHTTAQEYEADLEKQSQMSGGTSFRSSTMFGV